MVRLGKAGPGEVSAGQGRAPRIAVAASHDASPLAAAQILRFLLRLGHPTVLLRRGRETPPGTLEGELAELCLATGCPIEWRLPAPGGREEVFYRDIDLVGSADLVIAIFSPPERTMHGGTAHVVEKAIDQRIPVYAFVWTDRLERVGEHDPDNAWGDFISRL